MTDIERCFLNLYSLALQANQGGELDLKRAGTNRGNDLTKELISFSESDWREVFKLAENHRVFPMVYEVIWQILASDSTFVDSAIGRKIQNTSFFRKGYERASSLTCSQARTTAEFLNLYQFLLKSGLSPVVMKGIVCRNIYPRPEQRASSDEDLLVSEEDFSHYHQAFLDYGLHIALSGVNPEKDHEVPYCNSHVYIELHKKPFPPQSKAYGNLNRYFKDVERHKIKEIIYGVPVSTLDYTDHLFYLICHTYKHFLNTGSGIRMVSDIVLYSIMYEEQIEWNAIVERCREIHAFEFMASIFRIGDRWLVRDRFPEKLRAIWQTEEVDELPLLEDILTGGIYGVSSKARLHSSNITLGVYEAKRKGFSGTAFIDTFFPPRDMLEKRYSYLQKMPLLLPFAWAQRIGSYAMDGIVRKRTGNTVSEAVRIGNERVALMRRYNVIGNTKEGEGLLRRIYRRSQKSVFAPVLSPLYMVVCSTEYHLLNLKWFIQGDRFPTRKEKKLVRKNVTFIIKSFERQDMVIGLCRNISRLYPGTTIIVADDSHEPLKVNMKNVEVIRLPFNSGIGAGLSAALAEVKTPYILRLDDDELLTIRSKVHRELVYLMGHPDIDLIGFGHTTAIRLHSPEFNFKEYYQQPMNHAPLPLKIPHMTRLDDTHIVLGKVANIYLARTDKLKEVGFDPKIKVIDHDEFFWRAAGVITSAIALDTVVFHRHNPYDRKYNSYRADYRNDLDYIKRKKQRIIKEMQNEKE